MKEIEDDKPKLTRLCRLLLEYSEYLRIREKQPLAAQIVDRIYGWVKDNAKELP